MSKLSAALKALLHAPSSHPGTTPAPKNIAQLFRKIGEHAEKNQVERPAWLAMASAATFTMNSPDSLAILHHEASKDKGLKESIKHAELIREVGLKCIGLNGIPRTIVCLDGLHSQLPDEVKNSLTTTPSRTVTPANVEDTKARGRQLWDSIYRPHHTKLIDKLAMYHPDLPVWIVDSAYGMLFADPDRQPVKGQQVGRVLTSIVAIACLRAQTGVAPQLMSHVFGLKKAMNDETWKNDVQNEIGAKWLASDSGITWILESVDQITHAIGESKTNRQSRI
ncbi:hypothetical protein BT63DRAFT_387439 [Microthyrium microscopicum]|uniref:Dol-P-Man:Man(5)GlcNAc(2)-PP-Dol alpha-1,3-mannosyltransferase n=1 Tax=Microthyrium microscopicum TaxID=703497 RepID=A0A6A6UCN5_9PEZI|nr:hypothetical protein BT63DRAFT_387439 [Microthyrium microscopicum]